ncbi:hypothetical protein, unlikely [Trypanosoma brucei gambiense DAL972]|uniref:T. brucei spp.-specific protein n=1 Tax=Trypanosoma brucei gambiense (strain MHOM/CI/86/DAL972) TaxID=679716 RepID=D0A440_TRYB9|nr:hypothetical protein, unlikely [Trypanosoma brucei gambiense DAL972]CBH16034.1 hypothetical protein, unlikely [Trypanosoma brucei gambiense DAL972]|eukprot:XP_011778298.1 hypothetical protein, unlikely [Trypanosoma brucei gambiense DAL972]
MEVVAFFFFSFCLLHVMMALYPPSSYLYCSLRSDCCCFPGAIIGLLCADSVLVMFVWPSAAQTIFFFFLSTFLFHPLPPPKKKKGRPADDMWEDVYELMQNWQR